MNNVLVVRGDKRAARMVQDPEEYFRKARAQARKRAAAERRRQRALAKRHKTTA
jgi:hypothetical protein